MVTPTISRPAGIPRSSKISETLFNLHGNWYLTYQSILKGEGNLVVSIVTLLMLIFAVCNLLVDMLYAALDPRIRYA